MSTSINIAGKEYEYHSCATSQKVLSPVIEQRRAEKTSQRIKADMEWKGDVSTRYCVLYLKEHREHRTAWFKSRERVNIAFNLLKQKYGEKNVIVYMD